MRRAGIHALVSWTAAGATSGALVKAAESAGIWWPTAAGAWWVGVLADLGNGFGVWVLALVLAVRSASSAFSAALRATAFCAAMVAGYYVWTSMVLGYPVGSYPLRWWVVAFTAVPVAAALLHRVRAGAGVLAVSVPAVLAARLLVTGEVPRAVAAWEGSLSLGLVSWVRVTVDVLAAVLVTVGLPTGRSTRVLAPVLAVVLAVLLYRVRIVDQVWGLLG